MSRSAVEARPLVYAAIFKSGPSGDPTSTVPFWGYPGTTPAFGSSDTRIRHFAEYSANNALHGSGKEGRYFIRYLYVSFAIKYLVYSR
jgi:hypothetical protein